ncbi:MAG: hypothetical protein QOI86_4983 [Actinomycetota bacterium]|nr:hypothetical protein [Actinomycetota bacterium]
MSNAIGQSQYDYTFDAPVSNVALGKFVLYAADGTAYAAGFARPSAEVVRIAIPETAQARRSLDGRRATCRNSRCE